MLGMPVTLAASISVFEYIAEFPRVFAATLAIGIVCPLIGSFLLMRRMAFLGVTLPQVAMCGVSCGVFLAPQVLPVLPFFQDVQNPQVATPDAQTLSILDDLEGLLGEAPGEASDARENTPDSHRHPHAHSISHDTFHSNPLYEFVWAFLFTALALLGLVMVTKSSWLGTEGPMAVTFALASALTILFVSQSTVGSDHVEQIVRGDLVEIARSDFPVFLGVFAAALVWLFLTRRQVLAVSFDRDLARTLGLHAGLWDFAFLSIVSVTIAVGVVCVGPVVIFGLLTLPAFTARLLARTVNQQFLISSSIGVLVTLAGYWLAVERQVVMGASIVVVAGVLLGLALPFAWLRTAGGRS